MCSGLLETLENVDIGTTPCLVCVVFALDRSDHLVACLLFF